MEDHDYAGERVDSSQPKKKKREKPSDETAMESILKAVTEMKAALDRQSEKLDTQTEFLRKFETRVEANTVAIKENNDNIVLLQQKVNELQKENKCLKEEVADVARYKRRWNLRLNGLPEKDGEDIRERVIGVLTRVVPMSVERLRDVVDVVHRLGKRGIQQHLTTLRAQLSCSLCREWSETKSGKDPKMQMCVRKCTFTSKKTFPGRIERRAPSCGHSFKMREDVVRERS
ncbi:hypothetical protein WMY93_016842 [Mugilogobius chulae]|uniref:Uncharacterized protein n=1 Tax=Mugilogobius chulae TaxID=88201 RepID=A0AAW0NRB0_9GOBI